MDARATIYRYCQYQERCHREVRDKLYEIGCKTPEVESLISEVIEKGLLNEERYARAIARGKFRMKQWGKVKIIQQLKANKISDYCIKKALTEIDIDEYAAVLNKLAGKKWHEFRADKNIALRKQKVYRYLLQKGYENNLVADVINEIIKQEQ